MNSKISPQDAASATAKILKLYDTIPATDPKAFAAALAANLMIFPQSVIDRAVNPVNGVVSVVTFLNIAEIRKHLNVWHAEDLRRADLERRFLPKPQEVPEIVDEEMRERVAKGLRELAEKLKATG